MSHWDEIRRTALTQRHVILGSASGIPPATDVLAAAERRTSLRRVPCPPDAPDLYGSDALLDREYGRILYNRDIPLSRSHFYQAHEYAHYWLHDVPASCDGIDPETGDEPLVSGVQRVEGYGPAELREREANIFAQEFLLPGSELRRWYVADGMDVQEIAARAELPPEMVAQQLARALLTPDALQDPVPDLDGTVLDPSQDEAVHAPGPLLVEAGPGTGKTRTLVARIVSLLDQGVEPCSILALTFSNRAAEEMRIRLTRTLRRRIDFAAPGAASQVRIFTFHAFALELLRKYGEYLSLAPRCEVIDPADAITLLAGALPRLQLDHYRTITEPTAHLRRILQAISRAKDELCTPAEYRNLAGAMLAAAEGEKERVEAEKALEVAHVYAVYQDLLEECQQLDFGDLIMKTVALLRRFPEVRAAVRADNASILVDEYQDVNRASGLLLKEVAGDGAGLWVVGDMRQSIYRFRGASPGNIRRFAQDFPGARTVQLARNYRSLQAILDLVAGSVEAMWPEQKGRFTRWTVSRPDNDGGVRVVVTDDPEAEAAEIAAEIERQHAAGVPYREQAVLCRSHRDLARFAEQLSALGVPLLYLGDLFERSEVRDLLALLSLAAGDGNGLLRVAGFDAYDIPRDDVLILLDAAKLAFEPFPAALHLAGTVPAVSPGGRAGLLRLAADLDGLSGLPAWRLLSEYLFTRRAYLQSFLAVDTNTAQQQRLALYQFLQFAHGYHPSMEGAEGEALRLFLDTVRRMERFDEEKELRQVPTWADGIDGVRLLTIHAAKGLEFRAVYLPKLAAGTFPASGRGTTCLPPAGMIEGVSDEAAERIEEEKSLLFVGLSRARDTLVLSRARSYAANGNGSNPSDFLKALHGDGLISAEACLPGQKRATPFAEQVAVPPAEDAFSLGLIELYRHCPRSYFYQVELGLAPGKEWDYKLMRDCVYRTFDRLAEGGGRPSEEEALACLDEVWAEVGPRQSPYEQLYLETAQQMVRQPLRDPQVRGVTRPAWEVALEEGRVRFDADWLVQMADGRHVAQRIHTGRRPQGHSDDPVEGLYYQAAQEQGITAEALYLTDGTVVPIAYEGHRKVGTALGKFNKAMSGILRRDFPPEPDDEWRCPRCPFYFICPTGDL